MKSDSPSTLANIGPDSNSRCMDHLAKAAKFVSAYCVGSPYENAIIYHHERMTKTDQLAFDCFLVRMRDALAAEPGTPSHRFATRVARMVELSRSR